jgi:hypothetical protein
LGWRWRGIDGRRLWRRPRPKGCGGQGKKKRETGKNLVNEDRNLYPLSNIIMIESKRVIWIRHVACMGEMRNS